MSGTTPTKRERREAARAKRLEAERAAAAAQQRRRRMNLLLAAAGVALVAVVIAILVSSGGSEDAGSRASAVEQSDGPIPGEQEIAELLRDIPQDGISLGDPDAPFVMVEFVDLQCPFCRQFSVETLPTVVRDYVRPGKLRLELRTLAFIGEDSLTAARAAAAAAAQNRLWNFTELLFHNQGEENSGFVTDAYLRAIYRGAGVDVEQASSFADSEDALDPVDAARDLASSNGINSTPSFLIGPADGELERLALKGLDPDSVKAAIDGAIE